MELTAKKVADMNIGGFLGEHFSCACGKTHFMDMDNIFIESGAINRVAKVVRFYKAQEPLIIADENTYAVAGEKVAQKLEDAGIKYRSFIFPGKPVLVPDEKTAGSILFAIGEKTDLLLAVGTGVLNDITKYISRRVNIPEVLVATAPSMDGFVSDTAAPTVGNLKSSFPCNLPRTILGDTDILKDAPEVMILAGFGDIIGKYSALTDWRLSQIVNGEYFCEMTAKITQDVLDKCVAWIDAMTRREPEAIKDVMEGLIRTGIAMSYVNNSRPASGSEHHLSHYLEMQYLFQGKEALLHGTKVGITSIIVAKLYETLAQENPDFDAAITHAKAFNQADWEKDVRKYYGPAAEGVIRAAKTDKRNDIDARIKRIEKIREHWAEIKALAKSAKSTEFIEDIFRRAGAPLRPQDVGISPQLIHDAIYIGREVRTRYSIIRLIEDLGLTEKYTAVIDKFIAE